MPARRACGCRRRAATSRQKIRAAIDSLSAGGSTNGSAGIELAYEQAAAYFIKGGTNRVILCTDGDLNVGITSDDALVELIKQKAAGGTFLTVLGFGEGNLKDAKMEKLADNGNGLYAYIDSVREARKVLVEQLTGSTITIAKDVKIQIEFNPAADRRLPPARLREPRPGRRRISTTTRKTPAKSARATP